MGKLKNTRSKRLAVSAVGTILAVFLIPLMFSDLTYAEYWIGGSGAGVGTGSGHPVGCSTYKNARSGWCVNTDDGGASWHIYSINSLPDQPGGPIYKSQGDKDFLSGSGYSEAALRQQCPADKFKYYLAYVFDGRVNDRQYFAQWGPISEGFTFSHGTTVQMNQFFGSELSFHGSFDELTQAIKNGDDINGLRVPRSYALRFYQNFTASSNNIPPSVGYFCAAVIDDTVVKGKSNVSMRASETSTGKSDWGTSGENEKGYGIKSTKMANDNVTLCKGDEAYLTFSHSVLSNNIDAKANAGVTVSLGNLGLGVASTLVDGGGFPHSANMSGSGNVEVANNGYGLHGTYYDLFDGDKRYSDGGDNRYFYRDYLKVRFDMAGTYDDLCETLNLNGEPVTRACAKIVVKDDCTPCTGDDCEPTPEPEPEISGECGNPAWVPSSYVNSESEKSFTDVVSKVRNNSVSGMSDWADQVYAKPTDNPEWIHCYYPGVQVSANAYATRNHKPSNNEGAEESSGDPDDDYTLKNDARLSSGTFGVWQNQYTISASNTPGSGFTTARVPSFGAIEYGSIGDPAALSFRDASYNVEPLKVGDTLKETNTSGKPSAVRWSNEGEHSWDCKWGVTGYTTEGEGESAHKVPVYGWTETCSHSEDFISHYFDNTPATSDADVLVPYNFINTTTLTTSTDTRVFAGETKTFDFNVMTLRKQNNKTDGYYATVVRNASWKLELCYDGGGCQETATKPAGINGVLNGNGATYGDTADGHITVSIPDVTAGSKVCLRSAVFPATSGDDTNLSPAGDNSWAYSDQQCYVVAKRPSLQVWGGNIYTTGMLKTSIAKKTNVANYEAYGYGIEKNTPMFMYGSWGDSGIIASGGVSGFGSGASLGGLDFTDTHLLPNPFGSDNNNPLATEPGGSPESDACKRNPLTFANKPCSSLGALNNSANIKGNIEADKGTIISKLVYGVTNDVSGNVDLNDTSDKYRIADDEVYYYHGSGDLGVGKNGFIVNDTLVRVVHSDGKIVVKGDLRYEGNSRTFDEMPKIILYSEGDVDIRCDVRRIDAIIVAEGNVDTCSDADDESVLDEGDYDIYDIEPNDPKRSNQLIINGAVIANSVTAGRTYGAATGANSIVPAEIISFDPALYLWGGGKSKIFNEDGGSDDGKVKIPAGSLNVTYQKELAPRL